MSSTLLIILLVIVWLFVLAPMLIRARNPIRRTGDALAQTRTLYSGGSRKLIPKRGRTGSGPVLPSEDDAIFGLPSGAGSTDSELIDIDEWVETIEATLRHEAVGKRGEAVRTAMKARATKAAAASAPASEEVTAEIPKVVMDAAVPVDIDEDPTEALHESGGQESTLVVDGEVLDRAEVKDAPEEPLKAKDIDEEAALWGRGRRHSKPEVVELTEADLDFAQRRRGRGAYDPMADQAHAAQRYKARQRTALILAGVVLASVIAAVFTVPAVWWVAGLAVVMLAGYLTYLRRQVRLEESLRARRVERMRRARLGVESRDDDELSVVPPRLRRPGAVVLEIDDEDPAFDLLETYDSRHAGDPHGDGPSRHDPNRDYRRAVS